MKSASLFNLAKVVFLGLFFASCSKDRLLFDESQNIKNKVFLDTYGINVLAKNLPTAVKFSVKSDKDFPLTTKKGTKLWLESYRLWVSKWNNPTYPYDIEIIELYSLKDMLLYEKPTTSYGQMLTTGGAFYLNVTKDGKTLSPNLANFPKITVPASKVDNAMTVFYEVGERQDGAISQGGATWQVASSDTSSERYPVLVAGKELYQIFPRQFGWINCDKFYNYEGAKTFVKFESEIPAINKIMLFMVFPDISSVIQIFGGQSLEVPVGERVKIVAIAETEDESLYSFIKEYTVEKDHVIKLELTQTSAKDLLKALDKL